jgi:hypothetical protein
MTNRNHQSDQHLAPSDSDPAVVVPALARFSVNLEAKIRIARICSIASVIILTWFWLARTTGSLAPAAAALLGGFSLACAALGNWLSRLMSGLVGFHPGVAFELLVGFLFVNTALFVLTVVSPFGFEINLALIGFAALVSALAMASRKQLPGANLQAEIGSLVCVVFTGVVATLWVRDQQPIMKIDGDMSIFTVWFDVFIHVREISAFAQAHGFHTLSDIKLAGVPAAVYHFASYMVPAALNALTPTSALDSYAAFQLPFGILLVGLAAYVLPAVVLKTTWPAVLGSAAVIALPDAYQQGFAIRYLSFQFMSQVNLGMLYGLACISIAWLFMIEACRRERWSGVIVAFGFLAICVAYKAHLFVANALILMLYPCIFIGRFRWRWRALVAIALIALFVIVVTVGQRSPRMPVLRLDVSGLRPYVDILYGGFAEGRLKNLFGWLYYKHHFPRVVDAILAASLILFGSFGVWLLVTPIGLWKGRRLLESRSWSFVLLVVVNYMAMSMLLSLDDRNVGSREEFLNRPHAWAYFVVVTFGAAAAVITAWRGRPPPGRWTQGIILAVTCLALGFVYRASHDLETFPEWEAHGSYAEFNSAPACLARSAQYVRDHASINDVMQDSQFDPTMLATALAERQAYVIRAVFGGATGIVSERVAQVTAVQSSFDVSALNTWAHANHIAWYLMHPEDSARWDPRFLEQAAYRCEDFRVFRLAP